VVGADLVVPVGDEQQRPAEREPAAEERDHVERRLVGPVQVLQHDDRAGGLRRPVQRLEEQVEDLGPVTARVLPQPLAQRAAEPAGDVVQRAERARGEQRVASAPQHLGARAGRVGERGGQAGFAGARLAAEQRDPAAGRTLGQQPVQGGQLVRPFQQIHRPPG
jgi:hypothetical protein